MLYITTRSHNDAYTAHKALTENFAPDGGGYVPFQMPVLDSDALEALSQKSFSECVAYILNLFFSVKLTEWDVEFAIGRNPLKLVSLGSKITVAELHSNPQGLYSHFVKTLHTFLAQSNAVEPSVWTEIAVRIAMLFGVWSDLVRQDVLQFHELTDISLACEDGYAYAAALYARKMGLPLGIIVLSCSEGSPVWSLVRRGTAKADTFSLAESTMIERILQCEFDDSEVVRYLLCREDKKLYSLTDEALIQIKEILFAAAIGSGRSAVTTNNVAKKDGYTMIRNTACAYGGLEDFRAQCGIARHALLIAESRM